MAVAPSEVHPLVLTQVGLFAELPAEALAGLAPSLRRRRYPKGQVIFFQGDPGASLCLIETGRVKIALTTPDGREFVLALLGPGDYFGELSLLDGEPRSADAIALEACQLLLLQRDDFLRCLSAHPSVAIRLLAALSRRLRRTDQLVQEAAFLDVPARLARVLLEQAQSADAAGGAQPAGAGRLTQTELAGMIGATRESVNRWLSYFERQGLIRRQQGRITIVRPEGLRQRIY
jgi:CRP-like cAMP-binding protein